MDITNLALAYQIAELKPVVDGSILRKVQELERNWLKFKLQTRQGTKDLIASPSALFLTSYSMPAKQTTSGYGAFLRKRLSNKKILALEQHGFDRIAIMRFEDFSLVFELFAKGNVILADREMSILSAYRKEQWKDRALKKGQAYKFPSSKGLNPLQLDKAELKAIFTKSGLDLVRTLVKEVNIAPVIAEAACLGAGLEKQKPAKELKQGETARLITSINRIYSVDLKKAEPALVEKDGKEILIPIALNCPGLNTTKSFPSVNQALDQACSKDFSRAGIAKEQSKIDRKKAELGHSMQQQKEALESLQARVFENSQKAELIYQNYSSLFAVLQEISSLKGKKMQGKEIMYKIKPGFPFVKSLNLKSNKLIVSLEK